MITTLKLQERITLPAILRFLPQGGYVKFQTAENIKKKISVASEELEELEVMDMPDGTTRWNARKDVGKEYEFNEVELSVIRSALDELDRREMVTWDVMPLYKIFKESEPPKEE